MFDSAGRGLGAALPQRLWSFVARLNNDESSTFHRFATSKHVADLRWIIVFCLVLAAGAGVTVVLLNICGTWPSLNPAPDKTGAETSPSWVPVLHAVVASFGYLGTILGVFGAIVAWAYQTASARLGVVDLFACEIGTLCRVGALVDVARGMIKEAGQLDPGAGQPKRDGANGFTSQEDYFPVFNSNASDLKILEAEVVVNITAFYTYMKAMRDTLRKLAAMPAPAERRPVETRQEVMRSAIYMLFLAFESARKAIDDLIEFEPLRAECEVAILLTELEAYQFLLATQPDDFRRDRLELRAADYRDLVDALCDKVAHEAAKADSSAAVDEVGLSATALAQETKRRQAWKMAAGPALELQARYPRAVADTVKAA
jgi:hypothetical protein